MRARLRGIKQTTIEHHVADQQSTQRAIRAFLKVRTSYDVLPLSYRLIVFDTSLLVKKSLNILTQCGECADITQDTGREQH
jgi:hypothetical protein